MGLMQKPWEPKFRSTMTKMENDLKKQEDALKAVKIKKERKHKDNIED